MNKVNCTKANAMQMDDYVFQLINHYDYNSNSYSLFPLVSIFLIFTYIRSI